jgi:hypothetical protein
MIEVLFQKFEKFAPIMKLSFKAKAGDLFVTCPDLDHAIYPAFCDPVSA